MSFAFEKETRVARTNEKDVDSLSLKLLSERYPGRLGSVLPRCPCVSTEEKRKQGFIHDTALTLASKMATCPTLSRKYFATSSSSESRISVLSLSVSGDLPSALK